MFFFLLDIFLSEENLEDTCWPFREASLLSIVCLEMMVLIKSIDFRTTGCKTLLNLP